MGGFIDSTAERASQLYHHSRSPFFHATIIILGKNAVPIQAWTAHVRAPVSFTAPELSCSFANYLHFKYALLVRFMCDSNLQRTLQVRLYARLTFQSFTRVSHPRSLLHTHNNSLTRQHLIATQKVVNRPRFLLSLVARALRTLLFALGAASLSPCFHQWWILDAPHHSCSGAGFADTQGS